jgi:hypothetical protein
MRLSRRVAVLVPALLMVLASAPTLALQQTASQFYLGYRAAFAKAKSIDDLLPFMSQERVEQVKATPAADRAQMFEMIKMMDTVTDVKVVKETKSAKGATLSVEGLDEHQKKATATVELIKEGAAWKLDKETWSGSM